MTEALELAQNILGYRAAQNILDGSGTVAALKFQGSSGDKLVTVFADKNVAQNVALGNKNPAAELTANGYLLTITSKPWRTRYGATVSLSVGVGIVEPLGALSTAFLEAEAALGADCCAACGDAPRAAPGGFFCEPCLPTHQPTRRRETAAEREARMARYWSAQKALSRRVKR